jgi:hypothetical protein
MTSINLSVGTRIYTTGDMANASGFGTVTANNGANVRIAMDDGRTINVPPFMFSARYLGHCGTRFVTEAAHNEWWTAQMQAASR